VWQGVDEFFFNHIFSQALFEQVQTLYQEHAFWAVFTSGLTPIPYKVFTIAAGVAKINMPVFIAASIFGRGARFFAVGCLLGIFGKQARVFIEKYFNVLTIVFMILLIGGFFVIRFVVH